MLKIIILIIIIIIIIIISFAQQLQYCNETSYSIELEGSIVWNDTIQYSPEAVRYLCTSCLLPAFDDVYSVTCLRLSDVSVICRDTYFQFAIQSAFLPYIGRQAAPALSSCDKSTILKISHLAEILMGSPQRGAKCRWASNLLPLKHRTVENVLPIATTGR